MGPGLLTNHPVLIPRLAQISGLSSKSETKKKRPYNDTNMHQAAQIFCASNRKHMSQRRVASNANASCPLTSHQLIPLFACLLLITCHFSSVCLSMSLIAFSSFSCWAASLSQHHEFILQVWRTTCYRSWGQGLNIAPFP